MEHNLLSNNNKIDLNYHKYDSISRLSNSCETFYDSNHYKKVINLIYIVVYVYEFEFVCVWCVRASMSVDLIRNKSRCERRANLRASYMLASTFNCIYSVHSGESKSVSNFVTDMQ